MQLDKVSIMISLTTCSFLLYSLLDAMPQNLVLSLNIMMQLVRHWYGLFLLVLVTPGRLKLPMHGRGSMASLLSTWVKEPKLRKLTTSRPALALYLI